jgi:hypothetical protein
MRRSPVGRTRSQSGRASRSKSRSRFPGIEASKRATVQFRLNGPRPGRRLDLSTAFSSSPTLAPVAYSARLCASTSAAGAVRWVSRSYCSTGSRSRWWPPILIVCRHRRHDDELSRSCLGEFHGSAVCKPQRRQDAVRRVAVRRRRAAQDRRSEENGLGLSRYRSPLVLGVC